MCVCLNNNMTVITNPLISSVSTECWPVLCVVPVFVHPGVIMITCCMLICNPVTLPRWALLFPSAAQSSRALTFHCRPYSPVQCTHCCSSPAQWFNHSTHHLALWLSVRVQGWNKTVLRDSDPPPPWQQSCRLSQEDQVSGWCKDDQQAGSRRWVVACLKGETSV